MVKKALKKKTEKILPKGSRSSSKKKNTKKEKLSRAEKKALRDKKKKTELASRAATKRDLESLGFFERMKVKRRLRRDREARRRAEDLATLPKNPVARFFAHLHPKRVFRYWFSLRGLKTIGKFLLACILIGIIAVGALFLYFKKDVADIKLSNISISETVNKYLDRNGVVLWEDTGTENYRLVVDSKDIPDYVKQATISIEDKNFYDHPGVDFTGLTRAVLATVSGKSVQGGSTLTQQLIKQLYFADEAASANRGGIQRKIKELILALELEKQYDKDQILTMYLNESPYGGRRNGIESAAQTYFGKGTKDLTIAEAAFLASIPNNPAVLNPYNAAGNEALIERQQKTINRMVEYGYITQEQADEAKKVDILATVKPEASQYENILAPHFVLEVKSLLEEKYGYSTMRSGGFTIKTTLDIRAQQAAEAAVAAGAALFSYNGSDNIALASLDVETSQVIAMVGSVDFNNAEYGAHNAANSLIEPGSTIKPVLDYTPLFIERSGQNYGPGSVLKDENIDSIYCRGYQGSCMLRNYTTRFYGNVTIRQALSNSLNIPAVKALYINGVPNSLDVLHKLGDKSYCSENAETAGLSIAIGSGCNIRVVEHANTYASLSRGGTYKDITYVLEVKNSAGDILESWSDTAGERVVDDQVAYMIWDILRDPVARSQLVWGSQAYAFGFVVPGVETASKTGTTTTANSAVTKDSLMISYSSAISTVVWNGNHDGSGLWNSDNTIVRRVINNYMESVHKDVYAAEGKWHEGDAPARPAGIKTLTVNGKTDIWPSWYNEKTSGVSKESLRFNKYTKKLASTCTKEEDIETIEVTKMIDPMTNNEIWNVPEGYDRETQDDCSYSTPTVNVSLSGNHLNITVNGSSIIGGSYTVTDASGKVVSTGRISSASFTDSYTVTGKEETLSVTVTDTQGVSSGSRSVAVPKTSSNKKSSSGS
ncbi:transglycosylase domain-containing protein [Candidatus Saccharibacteria bacterium]|nr:transglycosylase domain-containing protein [Candidatus Saccharibacteria bacterium]